MKRNFSNLACIHGAPFCKARQKRSSDAAQATPRATNRTTPQATNRTTPRALNRTPQATNQTTPQALNQTLLGFAALLGQVVCLGPIGCASSSASVDVNQAETAQFGPHAPRRFYEMVGFSAEGTKAKQAPQWRQLLASARPVAQQMTDDFQCDEKIKSLKPTDATGSMRFALMVACAEAGMFSNLPLLLTEPFKTMLLEIKPSPRAVLLARVIAARGGQAQRDIFAARNRGVYLYTVSEATESENVESEVQYTVFRGRVKLRQKDGPSNYLSIAETLKLLLYGYRGGRFITYETGRFVAGVSHQSVRAAESDEEFLFLAKFIHPSPSRQAQSKTRLEPQVKILAKLKIKNFASLETSREIDRTTALKPFKTDRTVLANGLTVILHQKPGLPLAHVNLGYKVGSRHDPPGKRGLAHVVEHMMFRGSTRVGPGEHIRLLEQRGAAFFNAVTGFEMTQYVTTIPSQELPAVLWLEAGRMAGLAKVPDENIFQSEMAVVFSEKRIRHQQDRFPGALDAILDLVFPPEHKYHGGVIGTEATLQAITLDDVYTFHKAHYCPNNATISIVGDFDVDRMQELVEQYFSSIPSCQRKPSTPLDNATIRKPSKRTLSNTSGRYLFAYGWPGPRPHTRAAHALSILALALDDRGFGKLRQDLAAAGIRAEAVNVDVADFPSQTLFLVQVQLPADARNLDQVEPVLLRALKGYKSMKLLEEETGLLAKGIEQYAVVALESIEQRSAALILYDFLFENPNGLRWSIRRLLSITPDDILHASRRYLTEGYALVVSRPQNR